MLKFFHYQPIFSPDYSGRESMVKYQVNLSAEERQQLTTIVNTGKHPAYRIKHALILLQSDLDGLNQSADTIARSLRCHMNTVYHVRQCFVEEGLEASLERKKRSTPPTPRLFDGEKEARLIALRCGQPPEGCSRWTLQLLSDKLIELNILERVSYKTVGRVLKKMNLNLI
jgi:hypothetical protein